MNIKNNAETKAKINVIFITDSLSNYINTNIDREYNRNLNIISKDKDKKKCKKNYHLCSII